MLAIKLQRIGKKHQASYRLVVGEKRTKLNGVQLEDLGWYNPKSKTHSVNKERVLFWMGKGAQPTDTVHNLLVTAGVVEGAKRAVHSLPKKDKNAAPAAAAEAPAAK